MIWSLFQMGLNEYLKQPIKQLTVIDSVKTTKEKSDHQANKNPSCDRCHVFAYP